MSRAHTHKRKKTRLSGFLMGRRRRPFAGTNNNSSSKQAKTLTPR
jgi:hypothetical protein